MLGWLINSKCAQHASNGGQKSWPVAMGKDYVVQGLRIVIINRCKSGGE